MNRRDSDYVDTLIDTLKKQAQGQDAAVQPLIEMHAECEQQATQVITKEAARSNQLQELYRHLGSTLLHLP